MESRTLDVAVLAPLLFLSLMTAPLLAEDPAAAPAETREWALREMTNQAGRWIADNSAYRSDEEPYDAYAMEWDWAAGEKSMVGRLFPIRDGLDLDTVWEFRMIWHPEKRALWLSQFGTDGTVGEGAINRSGQGSTEALQTFFSPSGAPFRVGHRDEMRGDRRHVSSFDVDENGVWHPRRSYVWTRETPKSIPPDGADSSSANPAYEPLEWLIGEWQAQFRPRGAGTARPTMSFLWGGSQRPFLRMAGSMPTRDGRLVPEYESVVVYHPVEQRFVFLGVYHSDAGRVMEDGTVTLLEERAVRLEMRVHYPPGATLPFSDGATAGSEGHTLEFRRTFRPEGEDGLRGVFRIRRGDLWEDPFPEGMEGEGYRWKRISRTGPV